MDALIALEQYGTVSEAAVRLRLTQSAVSKRLQALQDALGFRLVVPEGRRIRLTPQAIDFLQRARPLVAELRSLGTPAGRGSISHFSLALADSIAASWGPAVVRRALDALDGILVDVHAHRSVLVIESVRLGRYHIGLCTDPLQAKDVIHHPLIDEPVVMLNSACARRSDHARPLITIENSSATWHEIEPQLKSVHPQLLNRHLIQVESFSAAAQMVRAGFGDGLLPLGLVMELAFPKSCYRLLPGVKRRVSLLTRKTVNQLPSFELLREQLEAVTRAHFSALGA
ncbi:LysR family transcriptional regulator [Undibacterium terreum]|uniref:LysR family transcriptional regulator n=1 Tax=Undibacterium terreum TaxID=1224302 RepID=UPI00166EC1D8|nr:LysR family transcriptional regulator [Undibacterium terreum]